MCIRDSSYSAPDTSAGQAQSDGYNEGELWLHVLSGSLSDPLAGPVYASVNRTWTQQTTQSYYNGSYETFLPSTVLNYTGDKQVLSTPFLFYFGLAPGKAATDILVKFFGAKGAFGSTEEVVCPPYRNATPTPSPTPAPTYTPPPTPESSGAFVTPTPTRTPTPSPIVYGRLYYENTSGEVNPEIQYPHNVQMAVMYNTSETQVSHTFTSSPINVSLWKFGGGAFTGEHALVTYRRAKNTSDAWGIVGTPIGNYYSTDISADFATYDYKFLLA